jgi:hypothetical protein
MKSGDVKTPKWNSLVFLSYHVHRLETALAPSAMSPIFVKFPFLE